jgi:hypothetical protein
MEVIRKTVRVDASRRVMLKMPEHVQPGEHDVLVVVGPSPVAEHQENAGMEQEEESLGAWLRRTAHDTGPANETTYRREDIYGNDGR